MLSRQTLGLALLLALAPMPAQAEDRRVPFLAVLEFRVQNKVIAIDDAVTLADIVRVRVVQSGSQVVKLISREKVIEILSKGTKSAAQCSGQCEIDTAREVGADFVLTGNISPLGDKVLLVLDVKKAQDGVTVASTMVKSPAKALDEKLVAAVDELVGVLAATLVTVTTAKPVDEKARERPFGGSKFENGKELEMGELDETVVKFNSTPRAAAFLGDKMLCKQTPCSRSVAIGRQTVTMSEENYLTRTETVQISKTTREIDWQLQADFATLNVNCDSGLAVKLDGVNAGTCPLRDQPVKPGKHRVTLDSPCHLGAEEAFEVTRGERKTVSLPVKPRLGGITVKARNDAGDDVTGILLLDGKELGDVPGNFRVPVCGQVLGVRSDGHVPWTQRLAVAEGEKSSVLAQMRRLTVATETMQSTRPSQPFTMEGPQTRVQRPGRQTALLVTLIGGLGLFVVGGGVGIAAGAEASALADFRLPNGSYDASRISVAGAMQRQTEINQTTAAAFILAGAGLASIGVAVYLAATDDSRAAIVPQSNGLALAGRF